MPTIGDSTFARLGSCSAMPLAFSSVGGDVRVGDEPESDGSRTLIKPMLSSSTPSRFIKSIINFVHRRINSIRVLRKHVPIFRPFTIKPVFNGGVNHIGPMLRFPNAERAAADTECFYASGTPRLYDARVPPHRHEAAAVWPHLQCNIADLLVLRELSRVEGGRPVRHHDKYDTHHVH